MTLLVFIRQKHIYIKQEPSNLVFFGLIQLNGIL